MGRLFVIDFEGRVYKCIHCRTHLATADDFIRLSGFGMQLHFKRVVNVTIEEDIIFHDTLTGSCSVGDIFCVACGNLVGSKHVDVGTNVHDFILMRFEVIVPVGGEEEEMQQGGSESEEMLQGSSESSELMWQGGSESDHD